MRTLLALLGTFAVTAHVACAAGSRFPGTTLAPDEVAAMERIAFARLAHERSCTGRRVSGDATSTDTRLKELVDATEAEVKPSWCKSNVHPSDLAECVSEIQHWPCAVELGKVTAIEACNVDPLCGVPSGNTL
jgi:hypothetical protein